MKIEIQPRDIQVMKFVFACRVVTYDQIIRRHFAMINEAVARRRIRRLGKAGFFKISLLDLGGKAHGVVQPLPKIWPIIREKWSFSIDNPLYKSESPEHDIRLTEV